MLQRRCTERRASDHRPNAAPTPAEKGGQITKHHWDSARARDRPKETYQVVNRG